MPTARQLSNQCHGPAVPLASLLTRVAGRHLGYSVRSASKFSLIPSASAVLPWAAFLRRRERRLRGLSHGQPRSKTARIPIDPSAATVRGFKGQVRRLREGDKLTRL